MRSSAGTGWAGNPGLILSPSGANPSTTGSLRAPRFLSSMSRRFRGGTFRKASPNAGVSPARPGESLEINFLPDPTIWDGQFANNGWLQELPKPVTRLTWDNAAMISPALAERLGLAAGEVVELELRGRTLKCPVLLLPGQAEGVVTLHLGYGRTHAGRVGSGTGFNAYLLRTTDALWFGKGLTRPENRRTAPACGDAEAQCHGRERPGADGDTRRVSHGSVVCA